jgi:hypothetical protein
MSRSSSSYEKLSTEEGQAFLDSDGQNYIPKKITISQALASINKTPKLVLLRSIPFITTTLVVIYGGVLLARSWNPTLSQITISAQIPPDFCGNTPAQAKAAGCMFEANNFALCTRTGSMLNWRWSGGTAYGQAISRTGRIEMRSSEVCATSLMRSHSGVRYSWSMSAPDNTGATASMFGISTSCLPMHNLRWTPGR